MAKSVQFQEKLRGIREKAASQDNVLSIEEVVQYFEEDNLSLQQLDLVYDYLLSQRIKVKGYEKTGGHITPHDAKDSKAKKHEGHPILQKFETEISSLLPEQEGEKEELYRGAIEGDAAAKSRLVELYLPNVLLQAKELYNAEIMLEDLVGEGNVSLLLALGELTSVESAHEEIIQAIRLGMEEYISWQNEEKTRNQKIVEKVNNFNQEILDWTTVMGREPTAEELSLYLDMPMDEVIDALKLLQEE